MLDSDRMTDSFKNRINNRTKQNEKKARQSNRCALHTQWILHLPIFCFFFSKTFIFSSPLIFFFLRRNIHYKRKNKKIREKWRNKSLKNHFLVFGLWFLDSFLLFSGSSPPISNSFFWNFIFSLWKVGKGWKATQHKRKEKTEIVENKITKQNL